MKNKRKLVLCSSQVDKGAIRREVIDGAEHIIVGSYTLPDDVVMNGGLYPADEIKNSFSQLERTLAPIEHPTKNGEFVSANDPFALHNFHAGAYNANVKQEGSRIYLEKMINVQEAMKSDRGKRLLDRIKEIETNAKARPIHTSTGLFLEIEVLDQPATNAAGDTYQWIARNMMFDHDAILLDSVGAATPNEGVGMAINESGDRIDVERISVEPMQVEAADIEVDDVTLSHNALKEQLVTKLESVVGSEWLGVVDIKGDQCIFETNDGFFQVPFRVEAGLASIVGIPIRVIRTVAYTPKLNTKDKGDAMKELMIAALVAAGITANAEMTDEELLAQYTALQANQSDSNDDNSNDNSEIADIVANAVNAAVAPLTDELAGLKTQLNEESDKEILALAATIVNSEKFPGMNEDTCKALPLATLRKMASNCGQGYGAPSATFNSVDVDESLSAPTEMQD